MRTENEEAIVASKDPFLGAEIEKTDDEIQWNPSEEKTDQAPQDEAAAPKAEEETPTPEAKEETPAPADPAASTAKLTLDAAGVPQWLQDMEPPKGALQRAGFNAYTNFALYNRSSVPVPRHWDNFQQRIDENYAFARKNSDFTMAIVGVLSVKGGVLKTTTATWLAAENARCSPGLTLLVDADSGGVQDPLQRFEISADTNWSWYLRTAEAADKILHHNWVPTPKQLMRFTPRHEESLARLLTMDTVHLSEEDTMKMIRALEPSCHWEVLDAGPGLMETNTYGIAQASTVPVVPGVHDNTSAMNALKLTLNHEGYGLRERLEKGDDVIVAIHAVDSANFNRRYQYEIADDLEILPRQVVLLPLDDHISKARPVQRANVSLKFLYAISELHRTCVESAIRYNQKYPMSLLPGDETEEKNSASQPAVEPNGDTSVTQEGSA